MEAIGAGLAFVGVILLVYGIIYDISSWLSKDNQTYEKEKSKIAQRIIALGGLLMLIGLFIGAISL